MRSSTAHRTVSRSGALALALAIASVSAGPARGQAKHERFWLAYRYDSTRVLVYFDTVKFNGTMPATARKITGPKAESFLSPVALPAATIAGFQTLPGVERFAIGDRYDLLLDSGKVATITLTTLVGEEGDEGTGGQSFIGAIGTVAKTGRRFFTRDFYAVTRHATTRPSQSAARARRPAPKAAFGDTVAQPETKTQFAGLLIERLKADTDSVARGAADQVEPSISARQFRTADGKVRYYAAATWPFAYGQERVAFKLGGWLSTKPTLQLLALETCLCEIDTPQLPRLLNVVDLGRGRTGVIVEIKGEFMWEFALYEYRDGLGLRKMRLLQSIAVGD